MRTKKKSAILAAVLLLVFLSALTACAPSDSGAANAKDSGAANASDSANNETDSGVANADLVIPVSEISETATFFPVTVDGVRMEVFAVKAPDGTIRTAWGTCQVCNGSSKAYFLQTGDSVQCQNCGNQFPVSRIGMEAGGCNPVPLLDDQKTVTDESITISYDALSANAYLFPPNWKS